MPLQEEQPWIFPQDEAISKGCYKLHVPDVHLKKSG